MYITIKGTVYEKVRRVSFAGSGGAAFLCEALPAGLDEPGVIRVYRDDGFLLREDDAGEYARVTSQAGALLLTNEQLPEPVAEPEETVSADEIEQAMREGVNSI